MDSKSQETARKRKPRNNGAHSFSASSPSSLITPSTVGTVANSAGDAHDEFWDCTVCTYRNSAEAFRCDMCQTRKGTSTRKPKLNRQIVEEQNLIARAILKEQRQEAIEGATGLDPSAGPSRKRGRHSGSGQPSASSFAALVEGGSKNSQNDLPPRTLNNVDRSSPLRFEVFANGYSVVITEYRPTVPSPTTINGKRPLSVHISTTAPISSTLGLSSTPIVSVATVVPSHSSVSDLPSIGVEEGAGDPGRILGTANTTGSISSPASVDIVSTHKSTISSNSSSSSSSSDDDDGSANKLRQKRQRQRRLQLQRRRKRRRRQTSTNSTAATPMTTKTTTRSLRSADSGGGGAAAVASSSRRVSRIARNSLYRTTLSPDTTPRHYNRRRIPKKTSAPTTDTSAAPTENPGSHSAAATAAATNFNNLEVNASAPAPVSPPSTESPNAAAEVLSTTSATTAAAAADTTAVMTDSSGALQLEMIGTTAGCT